jgi:putative membrane protein
MQTQAHRGMAALAGGLLALSAALWATGGVAQDGAAGAGGTMSDEARSFVTEAAKGNLGEVVLGARAQARADSAEVRQYGLTMVDDHHKANRELIPIVEANDLDWPNGIPEFHQQLMDKLKGLSGADFDRTYVTAMVEDHEKVIEKYEQIKDKVQDEALKQYVDMTLPILQDHLARAQQIAKTMEGQGQ